MQDWNMCVNIQRLCVFHSVPIHRWKHRQVTALHSSALFQIHIHQQYLVKLTKLLQQPWFSAIFRWKWMNASCRRRRAAGVKDVQNIAAASTFICQIRKKKLFPPWRIRLWGKTSKMPSRWGAARNNNHNFTTFRRTGRPENSTVETQINDLASKTENGRIQLLQSVLDVRFSSMTACVNRTWRYLQNIYFHPMIWPQMNRKVH